MRFADAYFKVKMIQELNTKQKLLVDLFERAKQSRMKELNVDEINTLTSMKLKQLQSFVDVIEGILQKGIANFNAGLLSNAVFYLSPAETTELESILGMDASLFFNVINEQNIENGRYGEEYLPY